MTPGASSPFPAGQEQRRRTGFRRREDFSPGSRLEAFHVMSKPMGPICNLDCQYCFCLEKEKLYAGRTQWAMADSVLESYIRQYIQAQNVPVVNFAWQGGEPTLLGVEFFRQAVALQKRYAGGKQFSIDPDMRFMADELANARPPANVMQWVCQQSNR